MKSIFLMTGLLGIMAFSSCGFDDTTLSFEDQLAKDVEIIDDYLAEKDIVAEIHESSIRYVVTLEGTGAQPVSSDNVTVKYEGRFLNGDVFDGSSINISFPLTRVISAWQITVPLMKEGGKITIYAPSGYCYGPSGRDQIPPNEVLIFDIELIGIN